MVCDDLGITQFARQAQPKVDGCMKVKDKADLLEAFLGALYIDKVRKKSFTTIVLFQDEKYHVNV